MKINVTDIQWNLDMEQVSDMFMSCIGMEEQHIWTGTSRQHYANMTAEERRSLVKSNFSAHKNQAMDFLMLPTEETFAFGKLSRVHHMLGTEEGRKDAAKTYLEYLYGWPVSDCTVTVERSEC